LRGPEKKDRHEGVTKPKKSKKSGAEKRGGHPKAPDASNQRTNSRSENSKACPGVENTNDLRAQKPRQLSLENWQANREEKSQPNPHCKISAGGAGGTIQNRPPKLTFKLIIGKQKNRD